MFFRRLQYTWTKQDTRKLERLIREHGPSLTTITPHFEQPESFLKYRLSAFTDPKRGNWTLSEDLLLARHLVQQEGSLFSVAQKLNRSYQTVRNRVHYFMNPFMRKERDPLKHFETLIQAKGTDYPSYKDTTSYLGPWTAQEDQTLLKTHRLVGGNKWSLIAVDLPGRGPKEIAERFYELNHSEITDADKEKIRQSLEVHKGHPRLVNMVQTDLPNKKRHQIEYIIKKLEHLDQKLTLEQQQLISDRIAQMGESYFGSQECTADLPHHSENFLRCQWAVVEPPDQPNQIWTKQVDAQILELHQSMKPKEIKKALSGRFSANEIRWRIKRIENFHALDCQVLSPWTYEEDSLLGRLHQEGKSCREIAKQLKFKTGQMCKNRLQFLKQRRRSSPEK